MLVVEGLTKRFSNGKGIDNVSFRVNKGEIFGFLGPNGAGKSTTIRHIMGFMKPDQGYATIHGLDVWKAQGTVQKHIGYLPGEINFFDSMTGISFLKFMSAMQGLKDPAKLNHLIERLQFDAGTPIRKMSKGMKQKVGIIAAFMHSPDLIVLDEPTSGLDPLMQKVFIDLVLEEKIAGTTFLMSSHSFQEIERTCDRAAIIKDGRLVTVKNIHELQSMQRKLFEVTFERIEDAKRFAASGLQVEACEGNIVRIAIQGNYDSFIRETGNYNVRSIDVFKQNLEDIFMDYYNPEGAIQ